MLEIRHAYKTFFPGTINEKIALSDLNLSIEDGEFVTVEAEDMVKYYKASSSELERKAVNVCR